MNQALLWQGIAEAALNYIVVSSISSMNQKQTVTDLKTDLRTTKEDLMAEIKDGKETVLAKIDTNSSTQIEIMKTYNDLERKGDSNGKSGERV